MNSTSFIKNLYKVLLYIPTIPIRLIALVLVLVYYGIRYGILGLKTIYRKSFNFITCNG